MPALLPRRLTRTILFSEKIKNGLPNAVRFLYLSVYKNFFLNFRYINVTKLCAAFCR